ncbi:peptidoglycan recognition family protein [Deinococcus sp.]|uniref:N-acetylmuramoyl-L-alanine amidase n=1 Tax=Deinococcus sp. TaxID=47478 RepID=UPI002869E795|nr:peptidoglycan recognition family protein [Deinococcus sp.]
MSAYPFPPRRKVWRVACLTFVFLATSRAAPAAAPAPVISERYRIQFGPARTALTLAYIRQHYDPAATSIQFTPVMVVIHWTASHTLAAALAVLTPDTLSGRADIRSGGALNVGAPFVVDRDGTIYRLIDKTLLARHTIGLNRAAIGIENVGSGDLTAAQLKADTALVTYLNGKYPLRYLIGHFEYGAFRDSPLWEERQAGYFTVKSDPGAAFMAALRAKLAAQGVRLKSTP